MAHDGFTLHDLCAYNDKHNGGNGEGNRDGTNDNFSWNCGAEGATSDEGAPPPPPQHTHIAASAHPLSAGSSMCHSSSAFQSIEACRCCKFWPAKALRAHVPKFLSGPRQNLGWGSRSLSACVGGAGVVALRWRQMRNFMVALLVSQGTPMVLSGADPSRPSSAPPFLSPAMSGVSAAEMSLSEHLLTPPLTHVRERTGEHEAEGAAGKQAASCAAMVFVNLMHGRWRGTLNYSTAVDG